MKILFVCSSNICRSPYCEYVFRRMCESDGELSAKIAWVQSGAVFHQCKQLHPKAKRALSGIGFSEEELAKHRPAYVRRYPSRFEEADIIVGMTAWHKAFIPRKLRHKYVNLSEFAGHGYIAVPDPFLEKTQEGYDKVMRIIDGYLQEGAERIKSGQLFPPIPNKK